MWANVCMYGKVLIRVTNKGEVVVNRRGELVGNQPNSKMFMCVNCKYNATKVG